MIAPLALLIALTPTVPAMAQMPPTGQAVVDVAISAAPVTPSDVANIVPTRALYVGGTTACDVRAIFADDADPVTLTDLDPGRSHPFSVKRVLSTGTTCTELWALR